MLAAVEIYPAPPMANPSRSHAVRAQGEPVVVERYAGVGSARFAMRGSVTDAARAPQMPACQPMSGTTAG